MRRTRRKHVKMLSYDGRCHPACSFGPFYGCLARERLEQAAVALFYPHNRRSSTLVLCHGRRPELFTLPSLQAGPQYLPRRDGFGATAHTSRISNSPRIRTPKSALNTCEKAPTLRSTTAPPLPLSVAARTHVAQMPPARSGLALPGPRMAACVELGFSLNFADAAAPQSPRVGPELRTQPPSSRGRLLPSHGVAPASPRESPVGNARASPARQRTKR